MNFRQYFDRPGIALRASEIGLVSSVAYAFLAMGGGEGSLTVLAFAFMFIAAIVLMDRRKHDEYILRLWNSGATAAFISLFLFIIAVPFIDGLIDGAQGLRPGPDQLGLDMMPFAIAAFFVAFTFQRLRGV